MGDTLTFLYASNGHLTRIGQIRLDATVREEHGMSARVTESPLESGANVADHVISEADTLNIDGVITETPVYFSKEPSPGSADLVEVPYASSGSRVLDGYEALRRLMERRQTITVVTGLRTYQDMVMTNLNVPREPETGVALRFSAELRQIRMVNSASIPPNKASPKSKSKAQKTANRGKQQAKTTEKPKNIAEPEKPPYTYTWGTGGSKSTTTTVGGRADVTSQVENPNTNTGPLILPGEKKPHIGHGTGHYVPEKKTYFRSAGPTRYRGIGGL